jgi:hypothetical protein
MKEVKAMDDKIILGAYVKCKISGFKGTITSKVEYLHGSPRMEVTGDHVSADGKPVEVWFNKDQLEAV